jgi:hypothetical protein
MSQFSDFQSNNLKQRMNTRELHRNIPFFQFIPMNIFLSQKGSLRRAWNGSIASAEPLKYPFWDTPKNTLKLNQSPDKWADECLFYDGVGLFYDGIIIFRWIMGSSWKFVCHIV